MSKTLRVFLLAALALALTAGGAFAGPTEPNAVPAATHIWTGNGDGTSWDDPKNWSPAELPGTAASIDVVGFTQSAIVNVLKDTNYIRGLVVSPDLAVTIRVAQACELKFGDTTDMFIAVLPRGELTLTGNGVVELVMNNSGSDFSFVTGLGASSKRTALNVDIEVKQDRVDVAGTDTVTKDLFFRVSDYSDVTFSQPVNNGIGNAWKVQDAGLAVLFGTDAASTAATESGAEPKGLPTHAMLCVNHLSQIQALSCDATPLNPATTKIPFVIAPMQGTLKVARSITVEDAGPASFQTLLSAHKSYKNECPVFEVVEGATFKLTAGKVYGQGTTPPANLPWFKTAAVISNDADFAIAIDDHDVGDPVLPATKFAKTGGGTLYLIGGSGDWDKKINDETFAPGGAAALDDEVHTIDIRGGTVAMEKGKDGRPAWEPSANSKKADGALASGNGEAKYVYVAAGAEFHAVNTEAVRPNNGFITETGAIDPAADKNHLLLDIRFENSGTVRIGKYAAMANLLDGPTGALKGERYPDQEAKEKSVYLLPRGSVHMVGDAAKLIVNGDQAFKRVWGGGGTQQNQSYEATIEVAASADLIVTEMDRWERADVDNADGHRFYGNVKGAGGVAFAKAYNLLDSTPAYGKDDEETITTQYFPFLGLNHDQRGIVTATKNDWDDDTIVYGRSRLVIDQDSILPKPSGESFSAKGAMYLRSDRPSSLDGDVGTLRARKTTVMGSYPDTVYIDHLKVDSSGALNSRAWIDVSAARMNVGDTAPYEQGDPYVPLSWENQAMRSYGLRLLAVKDVTYNVNKDLVTAAGGDFRNVYSFAKTGDSTLLILEKGRGGMKEAEHNNAIVVQRGRLWIRGEQALAEGEEYGLSCNSVTVNPSKQPFTPSTKWTSKMMATEDRIARKDQWTALHVGNGLDIKNDLFYEEMNDMGYYGLFVTELREQNRNYSALDGGTESGVRAAVNVATLVRGNGMDFQGSILQAPMFDEAGVGYMIFESEREIQDTVLRGFLGANEADTGGGLTVYTNRRLGTGPIGYVLGETAQGVLQMAVLGEADKASIDEMKKVSFTVPLESNVKIDRTMIKVEALTGSLGQLDHALTPVDVSGEVKKYDIMVTGNVNANRLGYYFEELVQVSVYVTDQGDPFDGLNGQRVYAITLDNPIRPNPNPDPDDPTIPESQSAVSAPSSSTVAHDATDPVTFTLSKASFDAETGALTILDENGAAKTLSAPKVYVNGTAIDGEGFFKDNGDGTVTVSVPVSALKPLPDNNTITVGDDTLRTKPVTVTKQAAPVEEQVTISTTTLPDATVGEEYTAELTYQYSTPITGMTVTWTVTDLPDGLECDAATGVISGTPEEAGTFSLKVTVETSTGKTASKDLTLTVNEPGGGEGGGSSGGCDAGFGALSMALVAALVLRKRG